MKPKAGMSDKINTAIHTSPLSGHSPVRVHIDVSGNVG